MSFGGIMSRVLLLNSNEEAAIKACARFDVAISVVEPLESGGVRLVCVTSDGAAIMRRKLRSRLIDGPVIRSPIFSRGAHPAPALSKSAGPAQKL
jgi:hypothetical protein